MKVVFSRLSGRYSWWFEKELKLFLCGDYTSKLFPETRNASKMQLTLRTKPSPGCVELVIQRLDPFYSTVYYKHYSDSIIKRLFTKRRWVGNSSSQADVLQQFLLVNNCKRAYLSCEVLK